MRRHRLKRRYGHSKIDNRFSRTHFGGDEAAADRALELHEAKLEPGTQVRVYRGYNIGLIGTIAPGHAPGRRVYMRDPDGLRWEIETRDLELI